MKVEEACAKQDFMDITEEDRTARRDDLVKASADNIILKILKESSSPDDLQVQMREQAINPGFLLFQAGPLIAFIFFLVVYVLYFCWACLPCCWCQCCRRKRNCPLLVKIIFMILICAVVLGLIIAAALSIRGFNSSSAGFEVTQCTAAKLVNSTMGGNTEFQFLGVIRTLEIFEELKNSLEPGSQFLNRLTNILSDTKDISDAVLVASATMSNINMMLSNAANVAPTSTAGEDLLHSCQLCTILSAPLTTAIDALDNGVGAALASTREVVAEQLQGDNLAKLKDSMLSGTEPLVELKTLIHSAFGPFVEQDTMAQVSDLLGSVGTLASVALIGIALVLALCSLITGTCWICIEKSTDKEGRSEHRRCTCRCGLCTWCCGCYYMLFVLLISGIFTAVAIPLASLCLIMEDVNGEILDDISRPLELDLADAGGEMMITMIEQCFRNEDPTANPLLLNLITVDNSDSPTGTMTMYELIVDQTRDSVNTQFDALTQQLSTGDLSLWATDSPIKMLADTLSSTPMSSFILPDDAKMQAAGTRFAALLAPGNSLEAYVMSGARCTDFTVPADGFGDLGGQTIEGINDFGAALRGLGSDDNSALTCTPTTGKATCAVGIQQPVCVAGNDLMDLKIKLRNEQIFKCYRFDNAAGNECNVVTQNNPNGPNGCLVNGAMVPREYDCNIDEFTSVLQTYYTSALQTVFQDLDLKTGRLKDEIGTRLKDLVNEEVMTKITTVADGMTCGFLGDSYQGVIDGLCYGGVWGFQAMSASYVACAVLTIFLVAITFVVWRISYDNVLMNSRTPIAKYEGS